jgi:hypothetical protein
VYCVDIDGTELEKNTMDSQWQGVYTKSTSIIQVVQQLLPQSNQTQSSWHYMSIFPYAENESGSIYLQVIEIALMTGQLQLSV